ncbi:MAG: hypothetical protein KDH96_10375 [Candidatus Riesia sp.]|nr:hypothetical protein [Candidatus Riesia sp.]
MELVDSMKEFSELVWLRQVKMNDEHVTDPKVLINNKGNKIEIGKKIVMI